MRDPRTRRKSGMSNLLEKYHLKDNDVPLLGKHGRISLD